MTGVKRLVREPLLHFLLIGAGLFMVFGVMNGPAAYQPNRIVVTSAQVGQMQAVFRRTWMRQPSEQEMQALIENYVRDQVYYREATLMGLDTDDPIVSRRLRQKLEFILEDVAAPADPGQDDLEIFLSENSEAFRLEPRISLRQIYLNPELRLDIGGDAQSALARLKNGETPTSLGDRIMVPHVLGLATESEIDRLFGGPFAGQVLQLEPGVWAGPIPSGYGQHLVFVDKREGGRVPELAEIREAVEREWRAQRRQDSKDMIYRSLRERYEVTIESAAPIAQSAEVAASRADAGS